jgi:hypothetical protein
VLVNTRVFPDIFKPDTSERLFYYYNNLSRLLLIFFSVTQRSTTNLKGKSKTVPARQEIQAGRKSLMQYTSFDWSTLPLSEERRLAEDSEQPMKVVTMYLR